MHRQYLLRRSSWSRLLLLVGLLLGVSLLASGLATPAHAATSTITSCTETALDTAISNAASGDTITFGCSGDILLTNTLTISKNLTLDGSSQSVTLDGGNAVEVLSVNSGMSFTLNALTIVHGLTVCPALGGGGLLNNGGTVTISNSTFASNSAGECGGGGLLNNGGTVTITNSTFANNSAGTGGGLYSFGTVTITNSTFANNSAGNAGGLYDSSGTVNITNSTFASNQASVGGGLLNNGLGTVSITNSTFTDNSGGSDGGGLYNDAGTVNITNSTFANGASEFGPGGLANDGGTVNMKGSIVANNQGSNCYSISDQGYNLSSDSSCGFTASTSQQNIDPMLASSLASNGGATQTLALLSGSPAINTIPGSACTVSTDQRGVSRPQGPACDIGAFEFRAPKLTLPGTITVSATSSNGAIVTYSVTASEPDDASATPTISCTPASGSTFPVGTTTVNCTASDAATPPDTTTGSFQVVVTSANPITQLANLITLVNSDHLKRTIQVSLDTELQVAEVAVQKHNTKVACASLGLFVTEVKTLTGHGITSSQASQLLTGVATIRVELGC